MNLEELSAEVQRLKDIETIKQMTNNYGYFIDSGNWQGMVTLFTKDCYYHSGFGEYKGSEGIIRFFRDELPPSFSFTAHMVHNPNVTVSGDKAKGQWYSEVAATHTASHKALWLLARYDAECVRLGGEWKFQRFVCTILYDTPFDEGWVKTKSFLK